MKSFLWIAAILLSIHAVGLVVSILEAGFSPSGGWRIWRGRLEGFSAILGQVVLVVFYLLVFPLFVIPARAEDPLRYRKIGWISRATRDASRADAQRQY